jgi:hypothetical protein
MRYSSTRMYGSGQLFEGMYLEGDDWDDFQQNIEMVSEHGASITDYQL